MLLHGYCWKPPKAKYYQLMNKGNEKIVYIFRGFVNKTYIYFSLAPRIEKTKKKKKIHGFVKISKSNVLGSGIVYIIPQICKHHQRISYTADYKHMDNKDDRDFVNDMIGHKNASG